MAYDEDRDTARAIAEAASIAKIAASTAAAAAASSASVERKVDAVLQDTGYIKIEQARANTEMARHITADAVAFDNIEASQTDIKVQVALLNQQDANNSKGFSINWGTIASVITMLIAALIAYLLGGR